MAVAGLTMQQVEPEKAVLWYSRHALPGTLLLISSKSAQGGATIVIFVLDTTSLLREGANQITCICHVMKGQRFSRKRCPRIIWQH